MERIQIFISSTFKDMDAERDMVNNFVKQKIEKDLIQYGIFKTIEIIDLRWGVNTQDLPEEERENKVLRQCVDNIRNSQPYFIGFIGARYGWIPPKKHWQKVIEGLSDDELTMMGDEVNDVKSVTELEILFGALKRKDSLANSFFLFRNPDVYATMDSAAHNRFYDSDEESLAKLELLKSKIFNSYQSTGYENNLMEYNCTWDGKRMYVNEATMGKVAECIVQSILLKEKQENSYKTELDLFISLENQTIREQVSRFVGRTDYLNALLYRINKGETPIVIVAPDGCGKTALVSRLYDILLQNPDEYMPFIHLTEQNNGMSHGMVMLKKWLWIMEDTIEGKCHLNMEANIIGLLYQFLQNLNYYEGKKIVLIIDNAQYLKGLNEILSYSGLYSRVSIILTSDREVNIKDFCNEGELYGLPLFSQEESLALIDRYTNYYNKSLPRRVIDAIAERTVGNNYVAMTYPLWTVILLHHLINIDVEDYEEMREADASDEADKITRFFVDRVRAIPSSVQQLIYWLDYYFTSEGQYNVAHEVILAAEKCSDIHQLRDKISEHLPNCEMALRSVLKEFSPLLYLDNFTDRVFMRYPMLFANRTEALTLEKVSIDDSLYQIIERSKCLMRTYQILKDNEETVAAALCRDEAMAALSCFDNEKVKELLAIDDDPVPHLSALSLDRKQDFYLTFNNQLKAYDEEPSWDNKICLQVIYYLWCSQVQYMVEYMNVHGADKNYLEVLDQWHTLLQRATSKIRLIISRNLVSYEGESLYFSITGYLASMQDKDDNLRQLCLSANERIRRCMWYVCPENPIITRGFAIALDSTYMLCPSLMEHRNEMSILLFDKLYQENECSIQDLLMALLNGVMVSKYQKNYDEVIQKVDSLIEKHLKGEESNPQLLRYYAIALDYKAEAYALKDDMEYALENLKESYVLFAKDYENNPNDEQKLHSLVINLEKQIRFACSMGCYPKVELIRYLSHCNKAIENNPGDIFAYKQKALGEILALASASIGADYDYIKRHTKQTIDFVIDVVTSCRDYAIINAEYIRYTIKVLQNSGEVELSEMLDRYYHDLAKNIIVQRIAPAEYFFPK